MIRRPPRSTLDRSSAASDVYKRQGDTFGNSEFMVARFTSGGALDASFGTGGVVVSAPVSYTHLRAHETVLDLVCRLLLAQKNNHHMDTDDKHELSTNRNILSCSLSERYTRDYA